MEKLALLMTLLLMVVYFTQSAPESSFKMAFAGAQSNPFANILYSVQSLVLFTAEEAKAEIGKIGSEVKGWVDKAKQESDEKVAEAQKKAEAAEKEATEAKAAVADIKVKYDEQQKQMDQMATDAKKAAQITPKEGKAFDTVLKDALTEATDDINKFTRKELKSFAVELKAVGDVTTTNVTGGSRYGQLNQDGIIMVPNRKRHIRELLPGGSIGPGNTFTFMREDGVGEGNPAPVAEGAMKPQFDVDLVEATVNIETIAGWMRVTRKAMNNIPGFISFLQARLPQRLLNVEDAQILYGSGATPNLKGILTAGNFIQSTSAATFLAEKIIDDLALLEDTHERTATGILLRPVDYYGFFKQKAAGSGEYNLPDNVTFVNGQLFISGIPVFASTALGQSDIDPGAPVVLKNDYIVGDFAQGAQLLTQEAMRIEFFEQDSTNVRENKVTIRIEETVALPIYGSNYFIKGNVV